MKTEESFNEHSLPLASSIVPPFDPIANTTASDKRGEEELIECHLCIAEHNKNKGKIVLKKGSFVLCNDCPGNLSPLDLLVTQTWFQEFRPIEYRNSYEPFKKFSLYDESTRSVATDSTRTFTTCNGKISQLGFCDKCYQQSQGTSSYCGRLVEFVSSPVKTAEEVLEKYCPSMNNLYLDDQGRNFRDRVVKAMEEYASQFRGEMTTK